MNRTNVNEASRIELSQRGSQSNTELRVGRSFLNQEKKGNMNYSNANATLGTELGQMSITVHRWDTLSHATLQTPKSWVNLKKEKKKRIKEEEKKNSERTSSPFMKTNKFNKALEMRKTTTKTKQKQTTSAQSKYLDSIRFENKTLHVRTLLSLLQGRLLHKAREAPNRNV